MHLANSIPKAIYQCQMKHSKRKQTMFNFGRICQQLEVVFEKNKNICENNWKDLPTLEVIGY